MTISKVIAAMLGVTAVAAGLRAVGTQAKPSEKTSFHYDSGRSGWNSHETELTPERVAGGSFGLKWRSPRLDGFEGRPPRLFASPLFLSRVRMKAGDYSG